ncbi:hypothetical protein XFF6990_200393 [Xanthomonas citri pv. fuscans]|nr:hypothetical protein XFF6990_200393 [Xanthomonas citri pv. fuscans]
MGAWLWWATIVTALGLSSSRKKISKRAPSALHGSLNVSGQLQQARQGPENGEHLIEAIRRAGSSGLSACQRLAGRKPVSNA